MLNYMKTVYILIFIVIIILYSFRPKHVELELLTSVKNNVMYFNYAPSPNKELYWWFIDDVPDLSKPIKMGTVAPDSNSSLINKNIDSLEDWNVDFNELGIDFSKNNIILSFSREIKEMRFKRADYFPYNSISTVKTIMSKNFSENTIYVYKIPKYDIREDQRAYTETSIEK